MEKVTYNVRTSDTRERWSAGPWDDEPDRVEWKRPSGVVCLALRGRMGSWCGYVGLAPGHPWHGQSYSDDNAPEPDVHGGLTYAAACTKLEECVEGTTHEQIICHVAEPGDPDELWWLGFDCAHMGDVVPGMHEHVLLCDDWYTYKNVDYAKAEIEKLAEQAEQEMQ